MFDKKAQSVKFDKKDIVIKGLTTALHDFGKKTANASNIGQFQEVLIIADTGILRVAEEMIETKSKDISFSELQLKCA